MIYFIAGYDNKFVDSPELEFVPQVVFVLLMERIFVIVFKSYARA